MVFNATFNNISVISWRSVLLVEETGGPGEKHDRQGRAPMVVAFTTTYAISVYRHWCCEFESWSGRGVQHYVIKFVSDLRQVGGFLQVLRFPPLIIFQANHINKVIVVWMSYALEVIMLVNYLYKHIRDADIWLQELSNCHILLCR
jgi:hypothetical protein